MNFFYLFYFIFGPSKGKYISITPPFLSLGIYHFDIWLDPKRFIFFEGRGWFYLTQALPSFHQWDGIHSENLPCLGVPIWCERLNICILTRLASFLSFLILSQTRASWFWFFLEIDGCGKTLHHHIITSSHQLEEQRTIKGQFQGRILMLPSTSPLVFFLSNSDSLIIPAIGFHPEKTQRYLANINSSLSMAFYSNFWRVFCQSTPSNLDSGSLKLTQEVPGKKKKYLWGGTIFPGFQPRCFMQASDKEGEGVSKFSPK
jgi:hypothetical protein